MDQQVPLSSTQSNTTAPRATPATSGHAQYAGKTLRQIKTWRIPYKLPPWGRVHNIPKPNPRGHAKVLPLLQSGRRIMQARHIAVPEDLRQDEYASSGQSNLAHLWAGASVQRQLAGVDRTTNLSAAPDSTVSQDLRQPATLEQVKKLREYAEKLRGIVNWLNARSGQRRLDSAQLEQLQRARLSIEELRLCEEDGDAASQWLEMLDGRKELLDVPAGAAQPIVDGAHDVTPEQHAHYLQQLALLMEGLHEIVQATEFQGLHMKDHLDEDIERRLEEAKLLCRKITAAQCDGALARDLVHEIKKWRPRVEQCRKTQVKRKLEHERRGLKQQEREQRDQERELHRQQREVARQAHRANMAQEQQRRQQAQQAEDQRLQQEVQARRRRQHAENLRFLHLHAVDMIAVTQVHTMEPESQLSDPDRAELESSQQVLAQIRQAENDADLAAGLAASIGPTTMENQESIIGFLRDRLFALSEHEARLLDVYAANFNAQRAQQ
ncbi:hypothetical protein Slin15195_G112860 [Septoria linicola]|uniref:Uncharacterized protein n=1 Tax=Septoria linicola TaxID=215465 RepID=A0A9Q9AXV3_9PEZI|nr:hypothetical protein Slin15195_G112860 [Septoria linicola]